ncbi:MAG TPA: two-component system regulatory protein YycI [Bacteroidales bacterium]|nr:two-component system regulatory protein YycI [Bacteroidales bacterium]
MAITPEELRVVEKRLNENNYFLQTSLIRTVQTSDLLVVSPVSDLSKGIMERFVAAGIRPVESDGKTIYEGEEETVVVHPNGVIQVFFEPNKFLAENTVALEERELTNLVAQFLNNYKLMPEGAQFDFIETVETGQIVVHYYQMFNNIPLFVGHLKVFIQLDHIYAIQLYWLYPIERTPKREIEIISAADALTNLIGELGFSNEPRQILQVELGFFSGEYDAERWEVPPVWRIVMDDGQKYYINAFLGNLEQASVIPEQLP